MIACMQEPHESAVVVWDPRRAGYAEGDLLVGAEVARARANGAVLVDAARELAGGLQGSGYARRGFGRGAVLDSFSRQHQGPLLLPPVLMRMHPGRNPLHWAAHLVRDPKVRDAHGALRLAVAPLDSGLPPGVSTQAHVALDSLPELEDPREGWVVQGNATIDVGPPIALPLCLSVVGRGFLARWFAVGQR